MNAFIVKYAIPTGLNYLFIITRSYLKCRSYGTLMTSIM